MLIDDDDAIQPHYRVVRWNGLFRPDPVIPGYEYYDDMWLPGPAWVVAALNHGAAIKDLIKGGVPNCFYAALWLTGQLGEHGATRAFIAVNREAADADRR